jgi:hypothetical protein
MPSSPSLGVNVLRKSPDARTMSMLTCRGVVHKSHPLTQIRRPHLPESEISGIDMTQDGLFSVHMDNRLQIIDVYGRRRLDFVRLISALYKTPVIELTCRRPFLSETAVVTSVTSVTTNTFLEALKRRTCLDPATLTVTQIIGYRPSHHNGCVTLCRRCFGRNG